MAEPLEAAVAERALARDLCAAIQRAEDGGLERGVVTLTVIALAAGLIGHEPIDGDPADDDVVVAAMRALQRMALAALAEGDTHAAR